MKTNLSNMLRCLLRLLARRRSKTRAARELLDLFRTHGGHSAGRAFKRADAYEGDR